MVLLLSSDLEKMAEDAPRRRITGPLACHGCSAAPPPRSVAWEAAAWKAHCPASGTTVLHAGRGGHHVNAWKGSDLIRREVFEVTQKQFVLPVRSVTMFDRQLFHKSRASLPERFGRCLWLSHDLERILVLLICGF